MYQRIVVPLDGSSFGDYAIRFAAEIARRAGASIELIHVHVPRHLEHELFAITPFRFEGVCEVDEAVDRELIAAEVEALRERAMRISADTGLRVTSHVVAGRVDMAVEDEAEAFHADLIVMATHARTGLDRLRLGSVADQVVRHATMPVLLVRPPESALSPPVESSFRHVMVPLDGSDFSEQVLPSAMHLAALFDAELSLVHVEIPPGDRLFGGSTEDETDMEDQFRKAGRHYLEDVSQRLTGLFTREPGLEAVVARYPIVALLETAVRTGADVIAMATHGRGGVSRMIVGSTANDLLRGTWLPILLHRPRAHHSEAGVDTTTAANTAVDNR